MDGREGVREEAGEGTQGGKHMQIASPSGELKGLGCTLGNIIVTECFYGE